MAAKNYIVALELGSSKVAGVVAVEGYDGLNIISYACEPVNGFITKGVVRNIDETGKCLTSIVNKLETGLDGATINKAYVALGGLSIKSIKSSVVRNFSEYTKITQEIIDEMALENDSTFTAPEGYQRMQVVTQEYKMGGDTSKNPIGMSVRSIESNYINIVLKEQYMNLLKESFALAKIEIEDSFTAAGVNAELLLNEDEKRDGCALVDIGAETTTIAIYTNNLMRKLCVLPLGGANITRDFQAEHISQEDAETLKIHAGYKAAAFGESSISPELRDNIIGARMMEILQNVNRQIKNSGESVGSVVVTGGGARLKNIEILLAENLPGLRVRIATDAFTEYNVGGNLSLKRGEPSVTLLGLLKSGKENCCQEPKPKEQPIMQDIFANENIEVKPAEVKEDEKEEQVNEKKEKPASQTKSTGKKKPANKDDNSPGFFDNIFSSFGTFGEKVKKTTKEFIDSTTKEDEDDDFGNTSNPL
ncbi:MAG: hypothetical protein IJY75_05975 [Bacteroidaceae bacterium]|nr:hypothetical protein [Bacteroidaceae bacterium]